MVRCHSSGRDPPFSFLSLMASLHTQVRLFLSGSEPYRCHQQERSEALSGMGIRALGLQRAAQSGGGPTHRRAGAHS